MKFLSALIAACLWAAPAAAFPSPVVIGSASAAAGSATLVITTTAACPIGSAVIVVLGQSVATTNPVGVADTVGNNYAAAAQQNGTLSRVSTFATISKVPANIGLPSGSTITATFGTSTVIEAAEAICWNGVIYGLNSRDNVPTGATGTSATPAVTPASTSHANCIQFVFSLIVAGAADTWTESTGYNSLTPVLATNALRVAWQYVSGTSPTAYSATNSSSRVWATVPFALIPAVCTVGSAGGGQC